MATVCDKIGMQTKRIIKLKAIVSFNADAFFKSNLDRRSPYANDERVTQTAFANVPLTKGTETCPVMTGRSITIAITVERAPDTDKNSGLSGLFLPAGRLETETWIAEALFCFSVLQVTIVFGAKIELLFTALALS